MTTQAFVDLGAEMQRAFEEDQFEKCEELARRYLEMAEHFRDNWNYGNALHKANMCLGRLALRKGQLEEAKIFLRQAGETPGSPQLNSFGPNMALAKELLELGEKEAVLHYLNACKKFWTWYLSFWKIYRWKRAIKRGEIPHFGGNMIY